ncbi:hypothetical protein M9Y10_007982 [Tritrichomonas musculus]|uniref:Protein kinase domain-containing protein n=1 Tax=Tritrichomonas musculus TaxID=1915356 RepID=A0ABR2J2U5_9EUKA
MNQDNPFLNLENFILLNKIGEGGFGEVFLIINKDLETKYVAKISKIPLTEENEEFKLSLKREVNLLAQINHPNIVKFIGYSPIDFHEEEFPVIITEYLPNGSLYDIVIHKNHFPYDLFTPTKRLINIFGIASIMSYLHKNNIIHRDLKLSNILLDEFLFPKLADFGLAKIMHSGLLESLKGIKGTATYLAPEILFDDEDPQYSTACDVYSFGFIMYEMFTRKQTNLGEQYFQIVQYIKKYKHPQIDESVPECYKNIIYACWSTNPSERPSFEQIVNEIKNNPSFVTNDIDQNEFHSYVKLIENAGNIIDPLEWFDICPKGFFSSSKKVKREYRSIYRDLRANIEGFLNFDEELKDILKSIINNIDPRNNKIVFSNEYCIILSAKNWFNLNDFIKILNHFGTVYFEIDYPYVIDNFYDEISNLKNLKGINPDVNLYISINIDESVKSIPPNAFYKCRSIYQINIPSSVTFIGDNAFYKCSSLKKIIIPSNVIEIGKGLFEGCNSLSYVEIQSKIDEIKENTFKRCQSLSKIIMPDSVVKIGKHAFEGCISLEELDDEFLGKIEYIGEHAFEGCESLKRIIISSKITSVNEGVFIGCSKLNEITIPKSVTTIESNSFHLCKSLNKIIFENPSSLISIKDRSFSVCTELEEISIPYTVRSIGKSCFFGCIKLKKMTASYLTLIEESTFDGCALLENIMIPYPTSSIESFAFNKCSSLKKVHIPNSVISINKSSFQRCTSLIEVTIPSSMKKIGPNAFKSCLSLEKIIIPSSVEEIGESALEGCIKIKEIEMKARITKINHKLFKGCISLTEIDIPDSVTEIGIESFCLCFGLKNLNLPNNLLKIEERAFVGCNSLEIIEIPKSVQQIGTDAFIQCASLKKINIPKNIKDLYLDDKTIIVKRK